MRSEVDPLRCPACGDANRCAVAAGETIAACWCLQAPSAQLIASSPQPAEAAQCYCRACLAARAARGGGPTHAR